MKYNYKIKTLRTTPAMAAGSMKGFMTLEDIINPVPEKTQGNEEIIKKKLTAGRIIGNSY